MIVNICGTSGSGKSTVVRRLIRLAFPGALGGWVVRDCDEDRRYGHYVKFADLDREVYVVGAYTEARATGGCDTVKDTARWFELVEQQHREQHRHVLYEGLYMMNMTRGPALARTAPVAVLHLDTSLEDCLAGIRARRAAAGRGGEPRRDVAESNARRAASYAEHMRRAGAAVERVGRDAAPGRILEILTSSRGEQT